MADTAQPSLHQLRHELKSWERTFAAANEGRKATRAEIKAHPSIAAKYKQYSQLSQSDRHHRQSPQKPQNCNSQVVLETQLSCGPVTTPRKPAKLLCSPEKTHVQSLSPTPQAIRRRLGPTPQRDGQILGLFDALCSATPSKSRTALAALDGNVTVTPSRGERYVSSGVDELRPSRTPTSSGKRFMLDTFATPMKRKLDEHAHTPSRDRHVESTPQFLKRSRGLFSSRLERVDELCTGGEDAADRPPFNRRPLVRSLSSIIKGLKAQEDAMFDDDLEALREAEEEESGTGGQPKQMAPQNPLETELPSASGAKDMPLGPDMPDLSSDDDREDANSGVQRKVWKKKGLKRQTKRVKMRPAPRPISDPQPDSMTDERLDSAIEVSSPGKENADPDFDDLDDSMAKDPTAKQPPVTKKKRKVNELAHANFCKLKIKNKNSKAKGRGRFGRR